jgi:hypothetical protein
MADDSAGKSIADAYRKLGGDTAAAAAPSVGASIADAYRTQAASAPPAKSGRTSISLPPHRLN